MLQRNKVTISVALALLVGLGIGWLSNRGADQYQDQDERLERADKTIKEQIRKIKEAEFKLSAYASQSDSLKKELTQVRSKKKRDVLEAMERNVNLASINKGLGEFERKYRASAPDSSIYFIQDEVSGIFRSDSLGLQVIQGILAENKIQKVEIKKLDSLVVLKDKMLLQSDTILQSVLIRERAGLEKAMATQIKLKKRGRNKFWIGLGLGIVAGVTGTLWLK